MDAATIMAAMKLGNTIAEWVAFNAKIAHQGGTITDDQFAAVKAEAGVSDQAFDARVAAAQARIDAEEAAAAAGGP